ncbi:hypothetical protein GGH12_002748 [Coemansia sp. RSA 1822]|nr:hypothetical protein LPJ76_002217 [Coemansia sp. RSA 638]KAJ2121991.1 hypothetical protein IW147_003794 [Coemansia sp. RSA 720]KAJ2481433.1 hypothetical protein IWW56_001761 [Coemansia sp. RSA 2131]KAJ2538556.1 hypothetical protein GGF49_005834 [Coemansia sp. RSA 1853]KAJ2563146.1 hypothetical protein GGH12_002748 [Coemansia sp. RSA 1822]KAJ2660908.1 hypothetical protein IW148_003582 [Coemansia sp. RSA 1199]
MGKRKSARKPQTKKKVKLDTTFLCLRCNHENTVTVEMDKANKIGSLRCKICNVGFQAALNHLSEPIDVYSDWVDACNRVNRGPESDEERDNAGYTHSDNDERQRGRKESRQRDVSPVHDEYGIPTQLSDDESDIDNF